MKRIGICGHYGGKTNPLNGQTIKTKIITEELRTLYGDDEVQTVDTYGGAKRTPAYLLGLWRLTARCRNVMILPAHNGVKILAPFLALINRLYRRKLHYIVIGGWLPELVSTRKRLRKSLQRFDAIYVETSTMKRAMEAQGFDNIVLMPNCKNLPILAENELVYAAGEPYKLCTFSRVNGEKGIEDAIRAVCTVNGELNRRAYTLDIYGQIEPDYLERFTALQNNFPDYIRYCGCVDFDCTTPVLKEYYALLFPTKYYTEGIPGTVIDAYAAGLPVISSRWESFCDVIDEGLVGLGYPFGQEDKLEELLLELLNNPETLNAMKVNCLHKAQAFLASKVVQEKLHVD